MYTVINFAHIITSTFLRYVIKYTFCKNLTIWSNIECRIDKYEITPFNVRASYRFLNLILKQHELLTAFIYTEREHEYS